MTSTRRDLFKFVGGSAVGALFTPVPWRLITDAALWSENWPGIPRPARGLIAAAFTNCSLCPAGCAVRARTVGGQPVSLAPVAGHPVSRGAMCPYGIAGHTLPYRPGRVTQGPVKEAAAAVAEAIGKGEAVAVLDLQPGRSASWTYRRAMAAARNGKYIAAAPAFGADIAVNLANAKTVVSFGAPLLECWGTPGNVLAQREHFRLIQVEAVETRTAALADQWIAVAPGSETALVLGLAHILLQAQPAGGVPEWFASAARDFTPSRAAAATGLSEARVTQLATDLAGGGPAVALDGAGDPAVTALNLLLGAPGKTLVTRREVPVPEAWRKAAPVNTLADIPDGSLRVLLIDESVPGGYIPWRAIEPKLARESPIVVAFAATGDGYGRHAKYLLPTAVYPEFATDIAPAVDAVDAAFRLSVPLVAPPAGMVNPGEFIAAAAGLAAGDPLRERADAIHRTARGTVLAAADAAPAPLKGLTADESWKALSQGAWWLDSPDPNAPMPKLSPVPVQARPSEAADLPLVAVLAEGPAAQAPSSPLMSKLYEESNLQLGPHRAALNPATAAAAGLAEGARGMLETAHGRCEIRLTLDADLPPGIVKVAARPGVLDVCAPGERAKVVRA